MSQRILGIDLGTTNSCVAIFDNGVPIVIPNGEGGRTTPSVVSFDKDGVRHVGITAKRMATQNPERTIQSIKRFMGTDHRVKIDGREFSPEQVSSWILQKLKSQAESYLGEKVSRAIITVPAYFDDSQRLATRNAGELAGLEVVRMINEPTASALAYGFNRVGQEGNLVVFDFGGGTFDVTILSMAEGVHQVRATNGNNRLGGDDFNQWLADALLEQVNKQHNVNFSNDVMVLQRLREAAENAKIELSGLPVTQIQVPFLGQANGKSIHLNMDLTREHFEKIIQDLVQSTARPIEKALKDANMSSNEVSHVLLVGGTTRIPAVQRFIRTYFNREPSKSVNPDEAVAIGAAIQGAILTGDVSEILLLDVIPLTLGVEEGDGTFTRVVERNTTIPVEKTKAIKTRTNQTRVSIHVLQGESPRASENTSLARFGVMKLSPEETVEVTFKVDADGLFQCKVAVGDRDCESVVLKRTSGYSPKDLLWAKEQEKEMVEKELSISDRLTMNKKVKDTVSNAEKFLVDYGPKLPQQTAAQMEASIENLKTMLLMSEYPEIEPLRKKLDLQVKALTRLHASAE